MEKEKLFVAETLDAATAERALLTVPDLPMTGWLQLPVADRSAELAAIAAAATQIQQDAQVLVCIGVGGSYLGHKALIEAIAPQGQGVEVVYAGNSLDPSALAALLAQIGERDFCVNVISKSGTTTEVLIAWRIFRQKLQERYGEAWRERVYVTTDANSGHLHDEAVRENYVRLILPDDVGGRYSVLSSVGLLPLAAAGVDIIDLLAGAQAQHQAIFNDATTGVVYVTPDGQLTQGRAAVLQYALTRQQLYRQGVDTEVLASFYPRLASLAAWWQQLFGESEGKDAQGIFPAAATYTTDLHSLGQFMQQGRRTICETLLTVEQAPTGEFIVPAEGGQADWLAGRDLADINQAAYLATLTAHQAGGIAVGQIKIKDFTETGLGALVFYLETACAVSALLAGVNPFDQPGVEAYKQEMFKLLGRDKQEALV